MLFGKLYLPWKRLHTLLNSLYSVVLSYYCNKYGIFVRLNFFVPYYVLYSVKCVTQPDFSGLLLILVNAKMCCDIYV